jgi:hypothetical protein
VTSVQGYLFKRPCPPAEIDFNDSCGGERLAGAA